MKKLFLLIVLIIACFDGKAIISKTVVVTAGNLSSVLTEEDKNSVSNLILKGRMDSRDFELFRSGRMYQLREIDMKDVVIESHDNSPKNVLPNGAFLQCGSILSLALPNTLTAIGDSALYKCLGLKSIQIPDSVKLIGKNAFSMDKNLTQIHLSSCLTIIEDYAFYFCQSLLAIKIPETVQRIGQMAFGYCGLTDIEIPLSVRIVGNGAFTTCAALRTALLPVSLEQLGSGVFCSCGLKYIEIPLSLDSIPYGTFSGCQVLDSIKLPKNIRNIGSYAFSGCRALTTIELPDSVTDIGDFSFYGCTSLTTFLVNSSVPVDLSNRTHMFDFIDKRLCALTVPKGSSSVYSSSVGWHEFLRITEFGNKSGELVIDTTELKRSIYITAGSLESALTDFELSNTTDLTINGEVDYRDFTTLRYHMPKLSILNMGGAVIKAYDEKYEENTLPYDAFRNSYTLTSITLPANTIAIGDYAFCNCTALNQVNFPESLYYIGKLSFLGCDELEFVECPPHLGIIDVGAFAACRKLFWITLPNSIEIIEGGAFSGCTGLEMVVLPESLSRINDATFSRCIKLRTLYLPESLTYIGKRAFESCRALPEVTIPENVTYIDSVAFMGCASLYSIRANSEFPADLSHSADVFKGVSNTCNLVVPIGAADRYKNSTGWNYFRIVSELEMKLPVLKTNESVQVWYDQPNHLLHLGTSCNSGIVTIFDARGRMILNTSVGDNYLISTKLTIKGLYIVQVRTNKELIKQKIIVK